MRLLCLVLVSAACHGGGGPVVAFSSGVMRAGLEVSGGFGPFGGRFGGTLGGKRSPGRVYATLDPGLLLPLTPQKDGLEGFLGVGGSLGLAFGDADNHLAAGGWISPLLWDDGENCNTQPVYSVTIGWRSLAGISEVFVAPKVTALNACVP